MNSQVGQSAASQADVEALAGAFNSFVKVTENLRSSYEKLRERAEKIEIELTLTNERLHQKVLELDHLSGHLDGILASIPSGVVVTDTENRVTRINAAAEKILQIKQSEALGLAAGDIRDSQGRAMLLSADARNAASTPVRERSVGAGLRTVLGGALSSIRSQDGKSVGTVEAVEDLTELWSLRERIHHLDKLAALGEMSAVIAHEIRNPLNGVQGFADLLSRRLQSDPKLAGYALNIVRGVREVDSIIADLLTFAAPERFVPSTVSVKAAVERAVELSLQSANPNRARKTLIQSELPESSLRVMGDEGKLVQIFRNLISNAIEAMPEGGRVWVKGEEKDGRVFLVLEDEGTGIPEEIREKIFDPFFTTKTQGTGLGLAIVRKLVELHQGEVVLVQGSRGARFELNLPAFSGREG